METCPVVKVVADNEQGYMLINESDFDENLHEKYDAENSDKTNLKLNKAEIVAKLVELNITHDVSLKKDDLLNILNDAEASK